MVKVSVEIKDNTQAILADLQKQQTSFVAQGAFLIQAESRIRVPVDTGNLRNSIITEVFAEDGQAVSETGPTADYAKYVEYGTSRQEAQPYMEPGFQAAKPGIDRVAKRLLG